MWKKLLDIINKEVQKILQLLKVTSFTAEYIELDNLTEF